MAQEIDKKPPQETVEFMPDALRSPIHGFRSASD